MTYYLKVKLFIEPLSNVILVEITIISEDRKEFKDIYKNADTALYQTKEKGKNGYTIHKEK